MLEKEKQLENIFNTKLLLYFPELGTILLNLLSKHQETELSNSFHWSGTRINENYQYPLSGK